ncbi:MAG: phage terminase large subunit family protein [Patescibacteria group bacterium]|nr:phage terminase large subunit family protein [Patescibacteria group bacterium]
MHPKQIILKPPQIGASETLFCKLLYVAARLNKAIIYTLPSDSDVEDMVGGKFNPIIAQNQVLRDLTADHDTIYQKRIGNSPLYLRGTVGKTAAMMVSSGLNCHDEVDASNLQTITQYETRQEAQEREEDKWRWMWSHPSLAGLGVDVYWQQSDKREWVVTCPACRQKQVLTWPNSLSRAKQAFVCKKCDEVIPDEARIRGYWFPTSQGEYHGYHISQLMLYNKTANDIFKAFDDPLKDRQYFSNYILGLPYQGGDDQITVEQVLKNCADTTNSQEGRIIIGVDTGLPIYYVLMNSEGVFYYGTCKPSENGSDPYDDLRKLLKRFPRAILVSDQGGDLIGIRKLQGEFKGRVFLAYYRKDRKQGDIVKWGDGDDHGIVTIDRNRHIQLVVEQLKETGYIKFNGKREEWTEFAEHFGNLYREKVVVKEAKEKDDRSLYGAEYVWKRRGPDHWAHALFYATVGMQKYGSSLASTTQPDILSTLGVGIMDNHFTGDILLRADSPLF